MPAKTDPIQVRSTQLEDFNVTPLTVDDNETIASHAKPGLLCFTKSGPSTYEYDFHKGISDATSFNSFDDLPGDQENATSPTYLACG